MNRNATKTPHAPRKPLLGEHAPAYPGSAASTITEEDRQALLRLRRVGGIDELHYMADVLKRCEMPEAATLVNRRAEAIGQSLRVATPEREASHV